MRRLGAVEPPVWAAWICLAVLAILYAGQIFVGVIPQDEGELFTYPWLMAHGAIPYREIWMMYPPSTYAAIAGLMKLGVPGLIAERGLGFLARLIYVLAVNRALGGTWRRASWLGVFATVSCLFLASADMRAYPWIVALPPAFIGLTLLPRRPGWSAAALFAAGAIRYEFVLVGCAVFALLFVYELVSRGPVRRVALAFGALGAATAAYYGAIALWAGRAGLQDIFVDPVKYIGPTQHSRLFPPTFGWLFLPVELLVIAGPVVLILHALRRREPRAVLLGAAALAFLPHFLNTADVSHLFSVACISIPLLLVGLHDLRTASGESSQPRVLRGAALITGVWTTFIMLAYGVYLSPLSPISPQSASALSSRLVHAPRGIVIASSPAEARDDRAVVAFLHRWARAGQHLFVAPASMRSTYTMTDLYYLTGLRPASPYLEFESGVVTRLSVQHRIIRDLRNCRWVVLLRGGSWYSPVAGRHPATALDRYIRSHYRPVDRTPIYEVLRRSTPLPRADFRL